MSNPEEARAPHPGEDNEDEEFLAAEDAGEEIPEDADNQPMDLDDEEDEDEEIPLQNDSIAHFDGHADSIFCIASHPLNSNIVITGGGDDVAYIFDTTSAFQSHPNPPTIQQETKPLLPREWENDPQLPSSTSTNQSTAERNSLPALQKLDGHTDSVNAVTFTNPQGEYVLTAGLDGKLRAWQANHPRQPTKWRFVAETAEVPEINWLAPCPCPPPSASSSSSSSAAGTTSAAARDTQTQGKNVVALGASDGSVWIYLVNHSNKSNELEILHAFYLHTSSCTAGVWTPDGRYLATVSEDGSLYVWDVFASGSGEAVISLTAADARFAVDGGYYSVAVSPSGTTLAAGGADGSIRIIGLPSQSSHDSSGGKQSAKVTAGKGQPTQIAGQILATLHPQTDSIETLSFSLPPLNLLAAGSVDGSIALFDTGHRFHLRRHVKDAHDDFALVQVEFSTQQGRENVLVSCGMDGVVRTWDARGGSTSTAAAVAGGQAYTREWRGHRGDGEGGGVLGFVRTPGGIVTAGDDGVSLVFGADQ